MRSRNFEIAKKITHGRDMEAWMQNPNEIAPRYPTINLKVRLLMGNKEAMHYARLGSLLYLFHI